MTTGDARVITEQQRNAAAYGLLATCLVHFPLTLSYGKNGALKKFLPVLLLMPRTTRDKARADR